MDKFVAVCCIMMLCAMVYGLIFIFYTLETKKAECIQLYGPKNCIPHSDY